MERALLGDWSIRQQRWRRQRGRGGNSGTVVGATAAAATNSGNKVRGTMAVSLERLCSVAGRWRKGNVGGNGGEAAAVSSATVGGSNGADEVG